MRIAPLLLVFPLVASVLVAEPAEASPAKMVANLRAEEAQPVPGPPGASGTARILADLDAGKVCYQLTYDGPDNQTVTAAHIHRGEKGVNGPVTINLDVNADCVVPGPAPVKALLDWPDGYYVEVHTAAYQLSNGPVRGQTAFE